MNKFLELAVGLVFWFNLPGGLAVGIAQTPVVWERYDFPAYFFKDACAGQDTFPADTTWLVSVQQQVIPVSQPSDTANVPVRVLGNHHYARLGGLYDYPVTFPSYGSWAFRVWFNDLCVTPWKIVKVTGYVVPKIQEPPPVVEAPPGDGNKGNKLVPDTEK